jgi:hypothetical protein
MADTSNFFIIIFCLLQGEVGSYGVKAAQYGRLMGKVCT